VISDIGQKVLEDSQDVIKEHEEDWGGQGTHIKNEVVTERNKIILCLCSNELKFFNKCYFLFIIDFYLTQYELLCSFPPSGSRILSY